MDTKILKNCIKHKLNVLFSGLHGVGKTQVVKKLFNETYGEMGVDWIYLSAATLDPWVDLIGIPKEAKDETTGETYLNFIRPKALAGGKVKAIFLDELNRAHPKVTNAVMELVQFKSINGNKFEDMEVIWAAINPHETDSEIEDFTPYTVEQLDPALKDRFHYHINVPYQINEKFFIEEFGLYAGSGAAAWWNELPDKEKLKVSPRRLETAVRCIMNNMPINGYVLDKKVPGSRLVKLIKNGSPGIRLREIVDENKTDEIEKFFKDTENLAWTKKALDQDLDLAKKVLCFVPAEVANLLVIESVKIKELMFEKEPALFYDKIKEISETSLVSSITNAANIALTKIEKTLIQKEKIKSIRENSKKEIISKNTEKEIEKILKNSSTTKFEKENSLAKKSLSVYPFSYDKNASNLSTQSSLSFLITDLYTCCKKKNTSSAERKDALIKLNSCLKSTLNISALNDRDFSTICIVTDSYFYRTNEITLESNKDALELGLFCLSAIATYLNKDIDSMSKIVPNILKYFYNKDLESDLKLFIRKNV